MVWKPPRADAGTDRNGASRRSFLQKTGTTGLALAGVTGLSGQAAAATVTLNQMKTDSGTFGPFHYRPTSTTYEGGTSMTVNKREYETGPSFVTYRFDITGTFEAITSDGGGFSDSYGFRIDFDEFESPITPDFHDHPGSDDRVQSGLSHDDGDYDASGVVETGIETLIEELVVVAGWVSGTQATVGSLMWALFQGIDSSVSSNNGEVNFSQFKEKRLDLGYYGLELTLDPTETGGVTFEVFNQTVGTEHTVSRHFDLDDH